MPINRLIAQGSYAPAEVDRLQRAYKITLKALSLVDRNDPLAEMVARKIIQICKTGADDPGQISARAIRELGLQDPS